MASTAYGNGTGCPLGVVTQIMQSLSYMDSDFIDKLKDPSQYVEKITNQITTGNIVDFTENIVEQLVQKTKDEGQFAEDLLGFILNSDKLEHSLAKQKVVATINEIFLTP